MTTFCLHASSERLTLYFYGELPDDDRRVMDEHVVGCDACAAAIADMHVLRTELAPRGAAARSPAEWDAFMRRLMPRLDSPASSDPDAPDRRRLRGTWRPVAGLAAALVLAIGGSLAWQRTALGPSGAVVRAPASASEGSTLEAAAARHFARAKLVVLGIAMKDPTQTSPSDWEYERQLAASLLPETRLFRLSAADRGDARLASLLGDLENVLLQASMTTDAETSELQRLQRVIRRRDLLVRMDLREL